MCWSKTAALMLIRSDGYIYSIMNAKLRKSSIEMDAITLDKVCKIMRNFGKL